MRSIRIGIVLAALAANLWAGPVYFTEHGKTFHSDRNCSMLKRSHEVLTAEETDAAAHGLHKCSRCYGEHKASAKSNAGWAQKVN